MKLEAEPAPLLTWLTQHYQSFGLTLLALFGLAIFIGFVASSLRHGPFEAVRMTIHTLFTGIKELLQISPRRVLAMARLSFKESIRRRVFVVFLVFVFLLMFAGWFLDRNSDHPARLYLSFVFTMTSYLVIFLAIFLSAFSIPSDVKNKTIFTIVTKPVRAWEVVLGRILGFCAIGTALLAIMCLASLIFVWRGVSHTHVTEAADLMEETVQIDDQSVTGKQGRSSLDRNHRHDVRVGDNGSVIVSPARDHTHEGELDDDGNVRLDNVKGMLQARVPVLGELRFLDRSGRPAGKGVSVGYESKYRSYIEGGSLATAIWRYEDVNDRNFPEDVLPVEMTLKVFRTHKGLIEQGLTGTMEIVRPAPKDEQGRPTAADGGLRSMPIDFTAVDNSVFSKYFDRKIPGVDSDGNEVEVDIFNDLATADGELEIWVRCLDRGQYFGVASADLYLRKSNRPFWMNFVKGYVSIWFQMVVVTCFGVTFSTFLNGAVAMLATLSAMVVGFNKDSIFGVASGEIPGGGPLESLVRLVTQKNQMVKLDETLSTWVIQRIDGVLMHIIEGFSYAMPNCGQFNTSNFIAYGVNVPGALISQHSVITLMYFLVLTALAYFFFKTREIAA